MYELLRVGCWVREAWKAGKRKFLEAKTKERAHNNAAADGGGGAPGQQQGSGHADGAAIDDSEGSIDLNSLDAALSSSRFWVYAQMLWEHVHFLAK